MMEWGDYGIKDEDDLIGVLAKGASAYELHEAYGARIDGIIASAFDKMIKIGAEQAKIHGGLHYTVKMMRLQYQLLAEELASTRAKLLQLDPNIDLNIPAVHVPYIREQANGIFAAYIQAQEATRKEVYAESEVRAIELATQAKRDEENRKRAEEFIRRDREVQAKRTRKVDGFDLIRAAMVQHGDTQESTLKTIDAIINQVLNGDDGDSDGEAES